MLGLLAINIKPCFFVTFYKVLTTLSLSSNAIYITYFFLPFLIQSFLCNEIHIFQLNYKIYNELEKKVNETTRSDFKNRKKLLKLYHIRKQVFYPLILKGDELSFPQYR